MDTSSSAPDTIDSAATDTIDSAAPTNKVTIASSHIQQIRYKNGSLDISDGQPSSPPPAITKNGSTWTIALDAGRDGTESVAVRFTQKAGGEEHMYAPFRGGGTPEKLNFSFEVTITFKVNNRSVPVDVYLAQGHSLKNNWWIGGNAVENINNTNQRLLVIENGQVVGTFKMSGGVSSFVLAEP
jgi:hypothetical protein